MAQITVNMKIVWPWWVHLYLRFVYIKARLGFAIDIEAEGAWIGSHIRCKVT